MASEEIAGLALDVHQLKKELDNFLNDTQLLIRENRTNIHKSVTELADSSELLNTHLNTILYHLEETSQNLHELTRALRDNPSLIIRGTKNGDSAEDQ